MSAISLSEFAAGDTAPCECCGDVTRGAGGLASRGDGPWVLYSIRWVPGKLREHGAGFDFSFPAWEGEPMFSRDKKIRLTKYASCAG